MRRKILIVDDEPEIVELLTMRLVSNGYEVFKASNGREAISVVKKENPDLIVLDIMIPDPDGSETAGLIRSNPSTKNIPIIFLTSLFTKKDEKEGNILGNTYFVAKPYEWDKLFEIIKKSIGK